MSAGDAKRRLGHLARPSGAPRLGVLVIHSWWGLTDSFTDYADRLGGHGLLAGCADLFDGSVASDEQEVRRLRGRRRSEPMYVTLQHCMEELRAELGDASARVALVGFSMGGHWTCWLTQHQPDAVAATVLHYAVRDGDFGGSGQPVLAHFAETDAFVSRDGRRRMERSLAAAGRPYTAFDYPGTSHWFAESAHEAYAPAAAALAFERTVDLLTGPGLGR